MNDEKDVLVLKLNELNRKRVDIDRKKQMNIRKIQKRTDMIVKTGLKSDEPLDQDILAAMFDIRNKVITTIKAHFAGDAKFRPYLAKQLDGGSYDYFYNQRIMRSSPEGRRRLLISMLYHKLQYLFFGADAKLFGVPREMEKGLQLFERQIETSNKGSWSSMLSE